MESLVKYKENPTTTITITADFIRNICTVRNYGTKVNRSIDRSDPRLGDKATEVCNVENKDEILLQ